MSLLRTTRGGKQVDIALNGGAVLGAGPGCQIIVADPAAAPKQCKIVRSPKGFVLTDLTSTGTMVNGAKVREHVLRAGDVLQIGSEKFVFAEKGPSTSPGQEPVAAGVKAAVASTGPGGPSTGSGQAPGGRRPLPSRAPNPAGGSRKLPNAPSAGSGQARKLTAKPGSVARVHHHRDLFTLPSTAKGRMIALAAAIGLVLLGGGLYMISANTVNSEQVKKAAKEQVEAFMKIPETDYLKRLEVAEEILNNQDFIKYAPTEIKPVEKLRIELRKQADLEKQADKVIPRFIDEYKTLKAGPQDEYGRQAERMWDLAGVHYENFKATKYGPQLEEIRTELKEFLEKRGLQTWSTEIAGLFREVQKLIKVNNFSQAMIDVDAFGKKYDEREHARLKSMLQEEREKIRDSAKSYVVKLVTEANGRATKEEKRRKLEAARPLVKGIPDAEKALEKAIHDIK